MKRRFLIILIAICAVCIGLASCGNKTEESKSNGNNTGYSIEGVTDIALSISQTEYDFLRGIVGWEGTTMKQVSVDSSAVQFGKVGAYEITYTLASVSKKATVRVYGTPEITGDTEYETFYSQDIDVFAGVTGKDSFGVELDVTTNHEFEKDNFGRIAYGEHFFRYYVTDSVGNIAYLDRKYTVKAPEGYAFDDVVVTVENPEALIDIKDKVLSYVIYDGEVVPASSYRLNGDVLDLSLIALELGKGKHVFGLSFEGGHSEVTVDMQITAKDYYSRPIKGASMVSLFNPFYDGNIHSNYVEWDENENAFHFVNYNVVEYDIRGFYMNRDYFSNLIEKGNAKKITFEMKFDAPADPSIQFYLGFMPSWFNKPGMQIINYANDYQTITVDLSKVEKEGGQYKTLFLLATVGGFYIKNIQIELGEEIVLEQKLSATGKISKQTLDIGLKYTAPAVYQIKSVDSKRRVTK